MRREILFSFVGFFGGFVVAGIIFWQPVSQPAGTSAVSEAAPKCEASTPSAEARPRTRTVLSPSASEVSAPVADSAPQPKGPTETFQEAMGKLRDLDTASMGGIIKTLSQQLRASGPEGTQALRDYFRAGQDVTFRNGYVVVDGKMVHSLRTALLDSLGDWPASVANEIALETLRSSSGRADASIAIRLLEKNAPGVYRAEAIQAVQQLAGKPSKKGDWLTNDVIFDTMRSFKAVELLPVAEAALGNYGWDTMRFITSLDALPDDMRAGALRRLFANETVTKYLPMSSLGIQSLNYAEPIIAENMARVFAESTDKKSREGFVWAIGEPGHEIMRSASAADRVAKWQARAAFLESIAPLCDTAVLQERLQAAREALQRAIANPDDNGLTKRGSGTLILNSSGNAFTGSTTVTAPGSIQVFTTTEKK